MAQPSVQGSFVWQELVTADTGAAGTFYSRVLGWRSQSSPHSSAYTMFTTASGPVAGMMRLTDEMRQKGAPPHWLPYIGADDVDATVASAERLGAKVHHAPSDIENNIGRFSVLTDPQGAAFGIYRPGQPSGPPKGAPAPGQHAWHELATSDAETAFDFYSKLFGWQVMQRMDMGAAGSYLIFGRDGVQRGGIYKLARAAAPHWLSYIEVSNADAAAAVARDAGAKVVNGPMDVPGGRIVQLTDPAGVLFAVHSAAKAAAQPPAEKKPAQPAAPEASAKPAAPKPPKRVEGEAPRPSAAPSGRGDGAKVTSAPAGSATKPTGSGSPAAGASARAPSSASSPSRPAAAKKAPAKAAKKAAPKKAAKKAPKKATRKAAAKKKSAARRPASKRGARSGRAAKKSSPARRAAKTATRKAGRKSASKRGGRRARHR